MPTPAIALIRTSHADLGSKTPALRPALKRSVFGA
jgi:hypothetical protein